MKIAIPTNDKKTVADHFGRCQTYLCFDEKGNSLAEINNTSEHMGGQGLPPELLKNNGVDVLLCKDLGPYAISLCSENNIKVYKHSEAELINSLFNLWQSNKLKEIAIGEGCESHQ
ncbi:MAG: NifB/NifX family molybdenum-iron cluster-binding protein [Patescibacteria group bacterium]